MLRRVSVSVNRWFREWVSDIEYKIGDDRGPERRRVFVS